MVSIDEDICTGCDLCAESCPARILTFEGEKTYVTGDATECMGCDACVSVCESGAVSVMEI